MSLMDKLASERRARLAAERMLALKSRELFDANRKLAVQAKALTVKVAEQAVDLKAERGKAEEFRHTAHKAHESLRAADENLKAAETIISTTQERFGGAIEAVTDGIALFDDGDVLVAGNSAWFALFDDLSDISRGTTYTEVLTLGAEEGIFDLGGLNPQQWIAQMLERWDSTPIPDMTLSLWNGRHYQLSDRRVANGDKISLLVDITDRIAREEELRAARDRAESAARTKAAFLANMSHELRTPMNGVVGMADLLGESPLDREQKLYVDTIRNSGNALLSIINDVLDFSKLEAGKMGLNPAPFDLERLIHEVLVLMQPTARDKDLELAFDYDLFLPTHLVGDAGRLRQILTNLIGNAIKFTEAGHVLVRVVGIQEEDAGRVQLHIAVEDTGVGIPAGKVDTIFDDFTQVENERNRSHDGTGLGLSITRELLSLMGGEIWVQSEEGTGSNFGFRLTLPLDGDAVALPRGIDPRLQRLVLVNSARLEADILNRQLAQLQLTSSVFRSGADLVRDGVPQGTDLLIVDERLIDTDAATLVQTLRETGTEVPAVLVTTTPGAGDPSLFIGTLQRPIRRDALIAELGRVARALPEKPAEPASETVEEESAAPVLFRPAPRPRPAPEVEAPDSGTPEGTQPASTPLSAPSTALEVATGSESGAASVTPEREVAASPDVADSVPAPMGFRSMRGGGTAAPAPPVVEPAPAAPPAPALRMRILAAEDNRTNQLVFRKMLKGLDVDLHIVENGKAAVESFESLHPHLVFMDISMPVLDGKAATRQIRWLETEGLDKPGDCPRHAPIVAMTAHAMQGDAEDILAAGLDRVLTKPLRKADLLGVIEQACPTECIPPLNAETDAA